MIMLRVDPIKLQGLLILLDQGVSPPEVRKIMNISRATYKRYKAEIRRVKAEAEKLMSAAS